MLKQESHLPPTRIVVHLDEDEMVNGGGTRREVRKPGLSTQDKRWRLSSEEVEEVRSSRVQLRRFVVGWGRQSWKELLDLVTRCASPALGAAVMVVHPRRPVGQSIHRLSSPIRGDARYLGSVAMQGWIQQHCVYLSPGTQADAYKPA